MTDMTVNIAFLDCPKNTPLREFHSEFGQYGQAENTLRTLERVRIYTYGQLLEYAKDNDFSDLPGIGAHTAERLHRFIEFMEKRNKGELQVILSKLDQRFSNIRDIVDEHIKERKKQNDVLRNYS